MALTGIITVVTNEKHNLEGFYNSLLNQTDKDFILYLVDNNSTDNSIEYFNELNKSGKIHTQYIQLNENKGFSGGSNLGAEYAIKDDCKYLLILNNDVIMEKDCLKSMREIIEKENNTVCAGMLLMRHELNFPDVIQEYGGKIEFDKGKLRKYFENKKIAEVKLPEVLETDFIGGGAMLIKANIFKEAGMFEENYFGYFDEIDLSYRLKVLRNYRMFVTAKAKAYHNHYSVSGSNNKKRFYFEYYLSERNKFLFFKKFGLEKAKWKMAITDIIKFPMRLMWFKKVCDWKLGLYYLKGMKDGLIGKKGKPDLV